MIVSKIDVLQMYPKKREIIADGKSVGYWLPSHLVHSIKTMDE